MHPAHIGLPESSNLTKAFLDFDKFLRTNPFLEVVRSLRSHDAGCVGMNVLRTGFFHFPKGFGKAVWLLFPSEGSHGGERYSSTWQCSLSSLAFALWVEAVNVCCMSWLEERRALEAVFSIRESPTHEFDLFDLRH